jgi:hypothetical protein
VARDISLLVPAPLWVLVALLPFLDVLKNGLGTLLVGTLAPFVLIDAWMPYAVYVHDYYSLFWWPAAAVASACLTAKLAKRPTVAVLYALLLLFPVAMGLRTTEALHKPLMYAARQVQTGNALKLLTKPDARVAVVSWPGDPIAPILAYYLDRRFHIYFSLDAAMAASTWDYLCFMEGVKLSPSDLHRLDAELVRVRTATLLAYGKRAGSAMKAVAASSS